MFDSARLKIERANHHIADLERQFSTFAGENPPNLIVQAYPKDGRPAVLVRFGKDPPFADLALIIGDAIHNLQTSLDHLTWELVGKDGGAQNRYLNLPTGDNRVNFEATCQGIVTPSQAVRDIFKSVEVFPGGKGDAIYRLHQLDNSDKHTILTPVIRATRISKIVIVNPDGKRATMINYIVIGGSGQFVIVSGVVPGMSVELDKDSYATTDIFLRKVEGAPAEPLIPTLRQFSHAASDTIDIITSAVS